jgi:hypothetical protein
VIHEKANRFFAFSQACQDGAGDPIGDSIELSVGELSPRAGDGKAVCMAGDLLLEPGCDGLVDPFEWNEGMGSRRLRGHYRDLLS